MRRMVINRHGLGDAGADYAAIAAELTPGSEDYQLFSGCAANPTAPACASAAAGALSTPYLTAPEESAVRAAIAAGAPAPSVTAYTGAPPGTQLPVTPASPAPVATATPSTSPVAVTSKARRSRYPVLMVQPAGAPSPVDMAVDRAAPASSGSFLTQPILGFPLWLWGVAAVGGFFLFGGSHGR